MMKKNVNGCVSVSVEKKFELIHQLYLEVFKLHADVG